MSFDSVEEADLNISTILQSNSPGLLLLLTKYNTFKNFIIIQKTERKDGNKMNTILTCVLLSH